MAVLVPLDAPSVAYTLADGLSRPLTDTDMDIVNPNMILEAPGPPPDGGLRAWLQILAGHLINGRIAFAL